MDIALGYAFVLAIAGGLIAICFSWLGEMMEDRSARNPRGEASPRQAETRGRFGARPSRRLHHQF